MFDLGVPEKSFSWDLVGLVDCTRQANLPHMARFDEKLPEDFVFLAYYDQINLSVAEVAPY